MPSPPENSRGARDLAFALALLACAVAVAFARYRPPAPAERDAPAGAFSALRAADAVARVLGDGAPRPSGTPAHARARARILEELAALGVESDVQETLAIGPSGRTAVVRNVVARIEGSGRSGSVLLCAHYDSVGASPGAADDGAGVATLIEIARALRASPPLARSTVLLFSDAAESGSVGATAFVERHAWATDVAAAIELEARGTRGPSVLCEVSEPAGALVAALAPVWPRPLASSAAHLVHKNLPSETDLAVFRAHGIPGIGLAFVGGAARFHTDRDDLAALDLASVQHQGQIALAALRAFDRVELGSGAAHERMFTDLSGLALVHAPLEARWIVAAAALAFALAAGWNARRRGELSWKRCAGALGLAGGAVAATIGAAALAGFALRALGRGDDPASCAPLAAQVGLAAAALAVALGAAASSFARRVGPGALTALELGLASLATAVLACAEPSAAHFAAIPAVAAGAVATAGTWSGRSGRARRVAAVVLPIAVAVAWLPVAFVLAAEFGFRAPHKSAVPSALIGASLLPAAISAPALARRAALAAAVFAAASFGLVALAPPRSEHAPDPLDVRYILDTDRGAARVEVSTFGAPLPPELGELRAFERASAPPFPWLSLDRSLYVAAAPLWDVPAPALEVLADARDGPGRVVRARIRSPRGAPRLHLRLPPGVSIAAASWNGHVVQRTFAPAASHLFFGVETGGVEIELRTLTPGAFDVWLLDQDWTLPPDVSRLAETRPRDRCRRADGDVSIVGARHRIAALTEK